MKQNHSQQQNKLSNNYQLKTMKMKFTMKLSIAIIAILFFNNAVNAQVKIGSNPTVLTATTNLEVEATNGTKVVVQKSNGFVGVGTSTPSTLLHVAGGTTSPAVKIVDGTEGANKVLTSDASGNASWQTTKLTTVLGNLPATGANIPSNSWVYTGANIVLPPGKWLVNLGSTGQLNATNNKDAQSWLQLAFNDNNTSFAASSGSNSTGGTSDYISSLSGNKITGAAGRGVVLTPVNGVIAINNASGANKTYYVWGKKDIFGVDAVFMPAISWQDVLGGSNLERYFYALPIN